MPARSIYYLVRLFAWMVGWLVTQCVCKVWPVMTMMMIQCFNCALLVVPFQLGHGVVLLSNNNCLFACRAAPLDSRVSVRVLPKLAKRHHHHHRTNEPATIHVRVSSLQLTRLGYTQTYRQADSFCAPNSSRRRSTRNTQQATLHRVPANFTACHIVPSTCLDRIVIGGSKVVQ